MIRNILWCCATALGLSAAVVGAQEAVTDSSGAVLRTLDKLNGTVRDLDLSKGQAQALGRIEVELDDCRYPEGNPSGDAYAFLTIREVGVAQPIFRGWMVASAPALNALDHPRYDVWVLRCKTS
ncbi:DUF2155 domain-containing protein [Puniceibacterium sp. IMCC21224]|uniref:DUF2155 domain-containing protein n=1 Tax=Puniceibacterium sp. IMCC21224 TaxID=1618204 RepID=UPI00064D9183|nr:DUF2155 domain-containing protein [Puniceibacterium sp. IMCC21224]KMK66501.1 hypothetical protein IMCC21224_111353 [Puniceibacterium sp. IMCC21224]